MGVYLGSCVSLGYQKMNEVIPFAGLSLCAFTAGLIGAGCAMRALELTTQKVADAAQGADLERARHLKQQFTKLKVAYFVSASAFAANVLTSFFFTGLAAGCWPLPELSTGSVLGGSPSIQQVVNASLSNSNQGFLKF